jgi:hypothetical protein
VFVEAGDVVVNGALAEAERAGDLLFALAFEEQVERLAESFRETVAGEMYLPRQTDPDERSDLVVQ